jgi:hypothetical protein
VFTPFSRIDHARAGQPDPGVKRVSSAIPLCLRYGYVEGYRKNEEKENFDMSRFPTAGHLISWAGLCPRSDESAGKRRSNRLRKGAPWLKTTPVQCAWAGAHKKASYLNAQFQHLRHRRGPKKTICAVSLHPHRRLPHAARWDILPRPRTASLPAGFAKGLRTTAGQADRQAWLRLHNHRSSLRGCGFCLVGWAFRFNMRGTCSLGARNRTALPLVMRPPG